MRNPVGTAHSPRVGRQGCTIFVKLQQFDRDDQAQFAIDTHRASWSPGGIAGIDEQRLHEYGAEHVSLLRLAPGTRSGEHVHDGGQEVLVLEGRYCDEYGDYPAGSWIRSPHRSRHSPYTEREGALLWIKTGHLG